jgi:hypothetical protein
MAREARGWQPLRQRVGHHMMRAKLNHLNYAAQAQLAEVVFPKLEKRQWRDEYDAGAKLARTQNRGCVAREVGLEARSSKRRERDQVCGV